MDEKKLEKIISQLDTAAGMLTVTAMNNPEVAKAHKLVLDASFQLGFMFDDEDF